VKITLSAPKEPAPASRRCLGRSLHPKNSPPSSQPGYAARSPGICASTLAALLRPINNHHCGRSGSSHLQPPGSIFNPRTALPAPCSCPKSAPPLLQTGPASASASPQYHTPWCSPISGTARCSNRFVSVVRHTRMMRPDPSIRRDLKAISLNSKSCPTTLKGALAFPATAGTPPITSGILLALSAREHPS